MSTPKRPRDPNQLAKLIADLVTGEVVERYPDEGKNKAAQELGPVDISWHPELCGGEGERAEEGDRSFVVVGGDAAELLEPVEHPLEAVAVL
jgi:hypothetical protein